MEAKLLHATSRRKLRDNLKKVQAQGWQSIGEVFPFLIFEGVKFIRLEFRQSIAKGEK